MDMNRLSRFAASAMILVSCFASCSRQGAAPAASAVAAAAPIASSPSGPKDGAKPLVVAAIFPDFDFARRVGGERIQLKLLLPPGVEAHSYEPTPSDVSALSRAALFVFTGAGMEPWAVDLAKSAANPRLLVVDASKGIELIQGRNEGGRPGLDPHIWLDPTNAARMAATIAEGLSTIDPAGAAYYAKNSSDFGAELLALDARIAKALEGAKRRTIIYGGHFAFGYFAKRYGLDYVSPYRGFSPDAEPSPRALAELIDTLKKTGSPTVFYEELLEPRVARVLAQESGARLELLHGAHNVTKAELDAGLTYLSIMDEDLRKLRVALGAP
jgi:zinc transport system substrate-binding protein